MSESRPNKPEDSETARDDASLEAKANEGAPEEESEQEPEPEPMTPERVLEWNAYYDIYVSLGVLLLVFLASLNTVKESVVFAHLRVGRTIAESYVPIVTDTFSFSQPGQRWTNASWVHDLLSYLAYSFGANQIRGVGESFLGSDDSEPLKIAASAEQWGIGTLVVLTALVRGLTAWVLLGIRKKGPGLWWACLVTTATLGVTYAFETVALGGIAGPASVSPGTWGLLFLAIELRLLHSALAKRHARSLLFLPPLFLVWANWDESFLAGLIFLAAAVAGTFLSKPEPKRKDDLAPIHPKALAKILGFCAVACVLNPSHVFVFAAAADSLFPWLTDPSGPMTAGNVSVFGQGLAKVAPGSSTYIVAFYLFTVGAGLLSFLLNQRRFSLPRFLVFLLAALIWAGLHRAMAEFAIVLCAIVTINGQEWYLDRFGAQGRLGSGWTFLSVGGRAVTLVILALAMAKQITGYGGSPLGTVFGVGFDRDEFAFEAAEFLGDEKTKLDGNVLNTLREQGDAILWKAGSVRKTFIDGRSNFFSSKTLREYDELRGFVRDDDIDRWKPALDQYKVSAVMIEVARAPQTYERLMGSLNWIPFHDDGRIVMFGRADAAEPDLSFFKSNQLDAEALAYKRPKAVPLRTNPPTAKDEIVDTVYQNRSFVRSQPHTDSALRWLRPTNLDPNLPYIPDPARCLLAVREARIALANKPDDTTAFLRLASAYRGLLLQETALLNGISLAPEYAGQINQIPPRPGVLASRFRQLVTVMNYAIITTPPPQTPDARRLFAQMNLELSQLHLNQGFVDLARDRLQAVIDNSAVSDFEPAEFNNFRQQLEALNQQFNDIQTQVTNLQIEQQAGQIQQAMLARSLGGVGLAIQKLEEANAGGMTPGLVKPTLLDLYCQTGQPDKALLLWEQGNVGDPVLSDGPGTAAVRQGRVFFLIGNYADAISIWSTQAVPHVRQQSSLSAPGATSALLRGDAKTSASRFLELPGQLSTLAAWEFDMGIAALDAGMPPDEIAKHFTSALKLVPNLPMRAVAAYYLERLGKPVPPTKEAAEAEAAKAAAAKTAETPSGSGSAPAPTPTPAPPAAPK